VHGFLPGLTKGGGTGHYDAISDPAVAYDAKHNVWMISSLPISNTLQTPAVVVSRSLDGGLTWKNPVNVDVASQSSDKNWVVCDNSTTSPFRGHCYMEWGRSLERGRYFDEHFERRRPGAAERERDRAD